MVFIPTLPPDRKTGDKPIGGTASDFNKLKQAIEDLRSQSLTQADLRKVELGYSETSVQFTTVGLIPNDIPGLSVTVNIQDRPVIVELDLAVVLLANAALTATVEIFDVTDNKVVAQKGESLTATEGLLHRGFALRRRKQWPTGPRTFKARVTVDASSLIFYNAPVTPGLEGPSSIMVTEI